MKPAIFIVCSAVIMSEVSFVISFSHSLRNRVSISPLFSSSNSDVFGGPKASEIENSTEIKGELTTARKNKFKEDAERLRREAAELEIALR